jgi:hypothetical protein
VHNYTQNRKRYTRKIYDGIIKNQVDEWTTQKERVDDLPRIFHYVEWKQNRQRFQGTLFISCPYKLANRSNCILHQQKSKYEFPKKNIKIIQKAKNKKQKSKRVETSKVRG